MIGKYQIELGANEFISGMASSDYAPDGGLGTTSSNLNAIRTPGLIQATAAAVDTSTNVSDQFIASCEHDFTVATRMFVGDAANFYTFDGSTVTKRQTGAQTSKYKFGITDLVKFKGRYFASITDDIVNWDGTSTAGSTHFDESWWVGTKSQPNLVSGTTPPHPLLVYNKLLWVGDANWLHYSDESFAISNQFLVLSADESILALGIDPATGMMLISTTTNPDTSDTTANQNFVYLYDGASTKPARKIPVDAPITAFKSVGGTVFVGYGQSIGYWTGSGVKFLRRLKNVTLTRTDLLYKHHLTNIRNFLLYVDGTDIVCYGEVIAGKLGFTPISTNPTNSNKLSMITDVGSNKIGMAFSSSKFYTVDLSANSVGTGTIYFNNVYFPRPVFIRSIRVITSGLTTTAGIGGIAFIDETLTAITPTVSTFVVLSAASPRYTFDFNFNKKCQVMQPRLTLNTQIMQILRVIIYYDVAE